MVTVWALSREWAIAGFKRVWAFLVVYNTHQEIWEKMMEREIIMIASLILNSARIFGNIIA